MAMRALACESAQAKKDWSKDVSLRKPGDLQPIEHHNCLESPWSSGMGRLVCGSINQNPSWPVVPE